MRILPYFFLYLFLNLSIGYSAEIRAQFSLIPETTELAEGDLVEGLLKVWPLENVDLDDFKKNLSPNLLNIFYSLEIHSVEPSINNADVIEVKALYIVKPSKEAFSSNIEYKGRLIHVEAPHYQVIPLRDKSKDFYVLNQSINKSYLHIVFVVGVILFVFIIICWQWKKITDFLLKNKKDPQVFERKMFSDKFSQAITREDYEEIYASKEKWLKLVVDHSPAYQDFFKTMNQHQFKKNWNQIDLDEVKETFDIIRGSFN